MKKISATRLINRLTPLLTLMEYKMTACLTSVKDSPNGVYQEYRIHIHSNRDVYNPKGPYDPQAHRVMEQILRDVGMTPESEGVWTFTSDTQKITYHVANNGILREDLKRDEV